MVKTKSVSQDKQPAVDDRLWTKPSMAIERPWLPFKASLWYQGTLPAGSLEVSITNLEVLAYGPWRLSWSPALGASK